MREMERESKYRYTWCFNCFREHCSICSLNKTKKNFFQLSNQPKREEPICDKPIPPAETKTRTHAHTQGNKNGCFVLWEVREFTVYLLGGVFFFTFSLVCLLVYCVPCVCIVQPLSVCHLTTYIFGFLLFLYVSWWNKNHGYWFYILLWGLSCFMNINNM